MHIDPEFWAPSFLPSCCRALWVPGEKSHSKCSSGSLSNSGSVHTGICNNYVIKTLLFIWHLIKSDFQWHTKPWKENDFKRRLRMCDKLRGAMKMTVKDLAWCALPPPCYPFFTLHLHMGRNTEGWALKSTPHKTTTAVEGSTAWVEAGWTLRKHCRLWSLIP